jgi:hypothetical protein
VIPRIMPRTPPDSPPPLLTQGSIRHVPQSQDQPDNNTKTPLIPAILPQTPPDSPPPLSNQKQLQFHVPHSPSENPPSSNTTVVGRFVPTSPTSSPPPPDARDRHDRGRSRSSSPSNDESALKRRKL